MTIAALAAAPPVEAQSAFLNPAELAWLKAFVDVIIPRTDTPGASDAGVPTVIDRRFATNPDLAERFRSGVKALDTSAQSRFGTGFAALTSEQQAALLTPLADDPFFEMMKGLTVDGYYTSQAGLTRELGWHGNTFLTEFQGCTHPEHQK